MAESAHSILVQRTSFAAGAGQAVFRLRILEGGGDPEARQAGIVAASGAGLVSTAEYPYDRREATSCVDGRYALHRPEPALQHSGGSSVRLEAAPRPANRLRGLSFC